jgi:hypothetical protein
MIMRCRNENVTQILEAPTFIVLIPFDAIYKMFITILKKLRC